MWLEKEMQVNTYVMCWLACQGNVFTEKLPQHCNFKTTTIIQYNIWCTFNVSNNFDIVVARHRHYDQVAFGFCKFCLINVSFHSVRQNYSAYVVVVFDVSKASSALGRFSSVHHLVSCQHSTSYWVWS